MNEVTAAIAKLMKGKTPGVCGIRAEMLKALNACCILV